MLSTDLPSLHPCETELNPEGNTGLFLQGRFELPLEIRIDYCNLSGVVGADSLHDLLDYVPALFWDSVQTQDKPLNKGMCYENYAVSPHSLMIAWVRVEHSGNYRVWVSLPGSVLARVSCVDVVQALHNIHSTFSLTPTRLDVALDDYSKSLQYSDVAQAIADKNVVGCRKARCIQNFDMGENDGFTVYFGSRNSDKMVRFYDKNAESKGKINSYRLEAELKDHKACALFDMLLQVSIDDEELISNLLLETVLGTLDFRDRSVDSNITRCPRLTFWNEFLYMCLSSGGIKLGSKRLESSIQKSKNWIYRSCAQTLAVLAMVCPFPKTMFDDIVDYGKKHLSKAKQHLLDQWIRHLEPAPVWDFI